MSVIEETRNASEDAGLKKEVYRRMLRIRFFEDEASQMAGRGEIPGVIHNSRNQEAAIVGATMALRTDDYMTGTHRSHGHPIGKGSSVDRLMAELLGKKDGVCKGKGGSMHLADFSVGSLGESGIVASGVPVAVGAGLSATLRGTDQVSLAFFGDGASNEGAIHEAMNLASVWKLPVIFFCENNHWAVTTSISSSTSVAHIAERGAAYSMPGEVVDGQDPMKVYRATFAAAERARKGGGPSIVEAETYRVDEHSEGMLLGEYRDKAEVEAWRERDPIVSYPRTLVEEGAVSQSDLDAIVAEVQDEVKLAVEFGEASPWPVPSEAFDDLFA